MGRFGVFALVLVGAGIGASAASYVMHQKSAPAGGKKGHGHPHHGHGHAGEASRLRHHARHHLKKIASVMPAPLSNPVMLSAAAGASIMAAVLYKPCECAPGSAAVPAGTPNASPPPAGATNLVPSTTQSNFGPIPR